MFVKPVSAKELRDFQGKSKRVADLISKSIHEAPSPSKNSPNTPLQNAEVKRPRLEVSSSPPVQVSSSPPVQNLRNNQPSSSEGVDEMWKSFVAKTTSGGDGDAASVWDDHFPLGDLIDKHFMQEKLNENVNELELEKVLQTSLTDSIRSSFILRVLGLKFSATEKTNKTYAAEISDLKMKLFENEIHYVGEINELKKKLSDNEKKTAEMTSLKAELNKLKKSLEESSSENTQLRVKEDAHKIIVAKMKADIEKLKVENQLQYIAGHDKAVERLVSLASELKPYEV